MRGGDGGGFLLFLLIWRHWREAVRGGLTSQCFLQELVVAVVSKGARGGECAERGWETRRCGGA